MSEPSAQRGRRVAVAAVGEIPVGGRKIVEVDERSIGVFHLDDGYVALRNTCPHQGAPLCEGTLSGAVDSPAPGQYSYERRGEILRCPWHQWEFEVRTGRSWVDPDRTRVRSYPVTTDGERIVIHL